MDPASMAAGAVHGGRALRRCLDGADVHRRDAVGVQRAEALEEHLRRGEPTARAPAVQREADDQRHRLVDQEPIGLVVAGEVEPSVLVEMVMTRSYTRSTDGARSMSEPMTEEPMRTLIKGGTIVNADATTRADVLVDGEKIA